MLRMRRLGRLAGLAGLTWILVVGFGLAAATVSAQEPAPEADAPADSEPPAEPAPPAPHRLSVEAADLKRRLEALSSRRDDFAALIAAATDEEDRLGLEEQNWRRQLDVHATIVSLVENVLRREKAEIEAEADRKALVRLFRDGYREYLAILEWRTSKADEARSRRSEGSGGSRVELEKAVSAQEERLQTIHRVSLEAIQLMERLDMDVSQKREEAERRVLSRAETLAGRLRVAAEERDNLGDGPEDAEAAAALGERIDRITDDLTATTGLLASLDLETAPYQQLLIRVTGEVTPGIFDLRVLRGLFQDWREQTGAQIRAKGAGWLARAFVFVLIIAVFRFLAAVARRLVQHSVASSRTMSILLRDTLVSWSSRAVNLAGLLVAVSSLGVEIGPLLAGLGIAGFIVGFALQDSLSNFAAGAMILAYRPFDVGDVIEAAGVGGKVQRMSLVSTTIHTFDNQTLILPNTKIWGDVIRNVTDQHTRRIDLEFRIGLDEDIDKAEAVLRDELSKHEEILPEPSPIVAVNGIGEWSIDLAVRPWVRTEDYWRVRWALFRDIKQRLDREGLRTPVPRVHVAGDRESSA